jgi:aminoglycoside phosphotransferase (APT) family kinase protein
MVDGINKVHPGGRVNGEEIIEWVATATGRSVTGVSRVGYGSSRATYLIDSPQGDLAARVDTGQGPMAGTELTLDREAEVYRALANTPVRIPQLHAVAPGGRALLVDRAPGSHELAHLPAPDKATVFDDYIDAIAEIHTLDVNTLSLPSYRRPTSSVENATNEIELWGRIFDERAVKPWPFVSFARRVLGECAPTEVERTVLCHGDVGPGNFVHHDGRVSAVLDWEFSHVGDPMDDLGWWVFRGHEFSGDCGDLAAQLRRWSKATGLPVDKNRIEYYKAVVMWRWLVSVAPVIDRGGSSMDRSVHHSLVPILGVRLAKALAGLLGIELPHCEVIPSDGSGIASDIIDVLQQDLNEVVAPDVNGNEARRRLAGSALFFDHIRTCDRIGATIESLSLDDASALLGQCVSDRGMAEGLIRTRIDEKTLSTDDALLYFWREAHRTVSLWPALQPKAFGRVVDVPEI